ncbi:chromosome segregation DNA-binding protein [Halobacillus karajensis]|uniref:Chromosome-partitioning protein ParB n=1 Tax=Halobacillus karajensis TaxID=195088 RepID=A0A059NZC4_9BACI|nr:ParB/RepB/Spo0J family partition protein [Halobacillus karajensis]CDQ18411.1 putative chromosome-partitioning protein ParB [Halobacillus karajensis]CDQ23517.1 putative chromosome-partitioning protein ParB [Halobacillus karajensis]CDQ26999.1 putative chromosome-partitioning protein ParB [Halobacillus karajensis]SEH51750.1 chromosome segregation DNA-binding protein [Halobacillus karajensis]
MERGLGSKGQELLGAFFNNQKSSSGEIQQIAIKNCRPNPYQPRKQFEVEALEELEQSIKEHGILQPLIVRQSIKGYQIVVGERRFRAAQKAGFSHIPALVKELTDEQMMEIALLENLQREDLSPIEEAQSYEQLIKELGVTQDELAKRLGKSRSHIANMIRLLALPHEITHKISEGKLSMGHGRALLSLKKRDQQIQLSQRIEAESLNVRQVERIIYKWTNKQTKNKEKKSRDLFLQEREENLKERLGTGVKIHKGKRKGKIEIEFTNNEDLERIIKLFDERE